jgi:hypothetical protein
MTDFLVCRDANVKELAILGKKEETIVASV